MTRRHIETNWRSHTRSGVDVFAVAVLGMLGVGLLLVPGLLTGASGALVILACICGAVMVLPTLLSVSELSTAMPRTGGAYFFIDRSLGPAAGWTAGAASWVIFVLECAFIFAGVGFLAAAFFDIPGTAVAVGLAVAIGVVQLVRLRRWALTGRVIAGLLVGAIGLFIASGVAGASAMHGGIAAWLDVAPALVSQADGLPVATAVVFVCFAGLVGIGSVAGRLAEAERSMSRGLTLALGVTVVTLGFVALTLAEGPATPSAASSSWPLVGLIAVAVAGLVASAHDRFGASARLVETMVADDSLPGRAPEEGEEPRIAPVAVVATGTAVLAAILWLDPAVLVRVLGGLTLLVFGALNLAVIVMRESEIEYYRPGFKSPLYPWIQVAGVVASALLIWELGWVAMAGCAAMSLVGIAGYFGYARSRVDRSGAVYHVFKRLGARQSVGLDHELREILGEKGLHDEDPYDHLIENATTLDLRHALDFDEVIRTGSRMLSRIAKIDPDELEEALLDELALGLMPLYDGVAVPHHLFAELDEPVMLIMRMRVGASVSFDEKRAHVRNQGQVFAAVFLLCPDSMMGGHLRMLSQLAARAEEPEFLARWLKAPNAAALKQLLSDGVANDSGESHDDLLAVIDWDGANADVGELGDTSSEDLVETLPPSYVDRADWLEPN